MTKWATPQTRSADLLGITNSPTVLPAVSINVGNNYGQIAGRDINNYAPPKRTIKGRVVDGATVAALRSTKIEPITFSHWMGDEEAKSLVLEIADLVHQIGLPYARQLDVTIDVVIAPIDVVSIDAAQGQRNPMWLLAKWLYDVGLGARFVGGQPANKIIVYPAPRK